MGRKRGKRNQSIVGTFTPVLDTELDSEAFRCLSGSSAKVLLHFKRLNRQLTHKHGEEIIFSYPYSRAKKAGFSESTFSRAIRELWEKGFLDIISIGGLRGAGRTNSQYKLCNYWRTFGNGWKERTKIEPDPFNRSEPL